MSEWLRVKLAELEYKNLFENEKIKVGSHIYGYVAEKINDPKNGEQAYIIVQNDPLAKNYDRKKVKNVTVLYRGSTGADNLLKKGKTGRDARQDWLLNDIPAAFGIFNNATAPVIQRFSQTTSAGFPLSSYGIALQMVDQATPQMRASAQTLHDVLKYYPKAQVDVYGHSLGSMNGQYALAHTTKEEAQRIRAAYLYEGPNVYSLLNSTEKKRADQLKNRAFNYVDPKDPVPMTGLDYRDGQKSVGTVVKVDSKKAKAEDLIKSIIDQHVWGGYQFDKQGNLKIVSQDGQKITIRAQGSQLATLQAGEKVALERASVDAAIASLESTQAPLKEIKKINNSLYPEMQKKFEKIIQMASDLPYITASDVANVVAEYQLEPKNHIDLTAVEEANQLVDQNLERVEQIIKGLKTAAEHIEQDDQEWSAKFSSN
ncbi:hypothetical protein LPAF129_19200 [Ligilactobacillus pabuli]|uniref:DUF2974 domain-containing protein n=1 Tax=Ligilactobacillus pabuli TaxID=2886039 RepID=A0ABQ5JJK8_9LACO|nr:hypothetical protein [Ligilactobacillus pabuli]GKS82234.1 hypothetical protein LPAF129_19200 [Ligilactobacillus pabuli]